MKTTVAISITVIFFLIFLLLFTGFAVVTVTGVSMEPEIQENHHVLISRYAYGFSIPGRNSYYVLWEKPETGDIVAFFSPATGKVSIKNCISLEKDSFYLNGNMFVSGGFHCIVDDRSKKQISDLISHFTEDCYFLYGSNSALSIDSRSFGPIRLEEIIGKVIMF